MTAEDLIEGLAIIIKYDAGANVDAAHDVIYAGKYNADAMTPEDRGRMERLGWRKSDDSWAHFT